MGKYKTIALFPGLTSTLPAISFAEEMGPPKVYSKILPLIYSQGYPFRGANGNGWLEPYEDWRLSAEQRSARGLLV